MKIQLTLLSNKDAQVIINKKFIIPHETLVQNVFCMDDNVHISILRRHIFSIGPDERQDWHSPHNKCNRTIMKEPRITD